MVAQRFPVEARLDGHIFVAFHLDVGIGDAVMEPLEIIEGRQLAFRSLVRITGCSEVMDFSVEHLYSHLRILAGNEEQCPNSGCL